MCVIIVAETGKPDLETLQQCQAQNPHGAGIAWRDGGVVKWKKGLKANDVFDIVKRVEVPFVIHFRMATQGGISDEMCHPFPVNKECSIAVDGSATKVLFHNGHWSEWEEAVFKSAISMGIRVPEGNWSDSRAMAWLVRNHGNAILKFIQRQKVCLLSNTEVRVFGDPWYDERKENGMIFSNKLWANQNSDRDWDNHRYRGRIGYMRHGVYVTDGDMHPDMYHRTVGPKETGHTIAKPVIDVTKECEKAKLKGEAPPEAAHGMMVWGDHCCA
jgi:hypothetical protein